MMDCREIEPELASYVEGEGAGAERGRVDRHLEACPACRVRVETERRAHGMLRARRDHLRGCAPEGLRQRCAAAGRSAPRGLPVPVSSSWVRWSLAASLLLAGGLVVLIGLSNSVDVYATQLAADHVKCFTFPPERTASSAEGLSRAWHQWQGWPIRIPPAAPAEQLELVGVRRCGSTRGRVAHVLYRWRGQPLSVYVLNSELPGAADGVDPDHPHGAVKKLGEQEIIWSDRGRTYAVVARASVTDLQRVAGYVRGRIE